MARTRASRAAPPEAAPPPQPRATLARRSRPSQPLVESSDSDEVDNETDVSLASESDSEDEADPRIDRSMGDLEIDGFRARSATKVKRGRTRRTEAVTPTEPTGRGRLTRPTKQDATNQTTPRGSKRERPAAASKPYKKAKTSTTKKTESSLPVSGIIPDWLSPEVPYSAWVDIFYYAAMSSGTIDNSWLVHAASTCKAFLEPALTALYRCPAPSSSAKAKKMSLHLQRTDMESLMINYRLKVESLYVDSRDFPAMAVAALVICLPRIGELITFTRFDQPPYRQLDRTIRWGQLLSLFTIISDIMLRSWEWSGHLHLLGCPGMRVSELVDLHETPTFAHLTRVSFTNFQLPSLRKSIPNDEAAALELFAEDDRFIDTLADSIQKLKHLKHLIFESSTVVSHRLLSRLPKDLIHLQLINCWEVTSNDLKGFLETHGSKIRFLTLDHNQNLDLAFLTDLATHSPKLEELHMNMSYYRLHDSVNDSDPGYEQALLPGQLPLWPSTLRVIEIDHIRQWSAEAAEMFLQSLIDSAPNLPDLRHLTIKTMIDVPWQRRAAMRQGWREKFDAVFLRPWVPPKTHTTLQPEATSPLVVSPPKKKRRREEIEPSRRSGRIATHNSDSDRQSPRVRFHSKPRYVDPDTDADELSEEEEQEEEEDSQSTRGEPKDARPLPVQGLCQTVDIMFDNQKVRELQYGMEDFEDDHESSGDEWDGDEDDGEDNYAW